MAEPKKRLTKTRSGARRSHLALKKRSLGACQKCKEPVLGHQICPNCGTYKGEKVISFESSKKKKNKE